MRFPKWLKQVWHGDAGDKWKPAESGFPPGMFSITDEEAAEIRRKLVTYPPRREPVVIRPPAFSPRHSYGGQGTIHRTTHIDVEVDPETRQVTAVWFRCLNLPFQVFERPSTAHINPKGIAIEEITYVDLPHEGSDL